MASVQVSVRACVSCSKRSITICRWIVLISTGCSGLSCVQRASCNLSLPTESGRARACVCVSFKNVCQHGAVQVCASVSRTESACFSGETCARAASVAAHISTCQEHVRVRQATALVSDCNSRWLNHRDLPECGVHVRVCMCVSSLHTRSTQESRTRRHLRGRDQRFFFPRRHYPT